MGTSDNVRYPCAIVLPYGPLAALRVDMDPLVVTGRLGEQIDLFLRDLVPPAVAEVFADV